MTSPHVYSGATTPRLNRLVMWLVRRGLSPMGAQILTVRGRSSGEPRRAPVNPLAVDGVIYLVAPRGHVQWTRNLRADPVAELRRGRATRRFVATEVADADKPEILGRYLRRWKGEVGRYFEEDSMTPSSSAAEWLSVAHRYPVFALTEAD